MFGFLKDKIRSAFDKLKGKDSELEEKKKQELKEEIVQEKKEKLEEKKQESKKAQKKAEAREEKLRKEEKKKEKKLKEEKKPEKKEEIKEKIKEEIKEVKQEIKEEIKEEAKEEKKEEKLGFFGRLKEKFTTTTLNADEFEELFEPIEMALIENNFSMKIIEKLKQRLKIEVVDKPFSRKEIEEKAKEAFKEVLRNSIVEPFDLIERIKEKKDKPYTIVFFGINGAGKTTTIAKLTHLLQKSKLKCVLAAADTFRAASIEQLEKHAEKLDVKVIKHDYGADPAAVAFDAISHARAKGIDVVLIDTAGRMHTKSDLMKEMEKICRVSKPDLKVFVGEAITGSDLLEQLKKFNEAIGIDAAILTKADVDEKGGAMISIGEVTGKPIIYIGVGQGYDDLEKFDKEKILKNIFSAI